MAEPVGPDDTLDEVLGTLLAGFRDEARELLSDMESALMELEERPGDGELVARAFRALHTIKGNGAMFGLVELEGFAHDLEHVFELLRKGKMEVTHEVVDLALGAKDRLNALLQPGADSADERLRREVDRRRIAALLDAAGAAAPPPELPRHLVETFKDEAKDLLADLESSLMQLEERPADEELIARVFRSLHTIKGNAGMFGFMELEAFAHELESVFELLRSRQTPATREVINLTLEARDRIAHLLQGEGDAADERALRDAEVRAFQRICAERAAAPAAGAAGAKAATGTTRIRFQPDARLFAQGTDPLTVLEELRSMGPCAVTALFDAVPPLERIAAGRCYLAWDITVTTGRPEREIRDAFIFVGGDASIAVTPAVAAGIPQEIGARSGSAPSGSGARPSPARPGRDAAAAEAATLRATGESASTLRVDAAKLDKLVDLVGELVTVQARLSRLAGLRDDLELLGAAEEVERLTAELRDHSLSARMVPIGPAFGRFRRLVRDLSHEVGRQVELVTDGEETELDKSVIDRLNDPIVHLLRNGIDHGIEPPAQRAAAGKPAKGRVRLSAAYAGATVVIRVEDDGAGIDAVAVRRKALQRGLIAEGDQRSEAQVHSLLFLPGFSTSDQVTTVSGRGVGLDVVKRAVEALRGRVRVESRRGEGTAFEIRIPLTLAIIEGLEVVLGDEHLILPLPAVRECVELAPRPGAGGRGRSLADIRGELVPYVRLREWFHVPGAAPAHEQIVVTETDGRRVGLVVDHVVGGQQTVIKPLGTLFRDVRGLSGATILGDGTVALILDVGQLVQHIERDEAGCDAGER